MKNELNPLVSLGHSMNPLLKEHDVIIPQPIKIQSLQVDDIVLIKKKSFFITHRIVCLHKGKIITKGDNNIKPDKSVKKSQIIGKVNLIKRNNQTLNIEHIYLFQSITYFKEITQISSTFSKQKINYVFLKGLPTYLHYIKTQPRRIYADCDILIDSSDLKRINKIFSSLGYKKQAISHHPLLDLFMKNKTQISYWKIINNFKIAFDIHLEPTFFFVQTNNLSPLFPHHFVKRFTHTLISEKKIIKKQKESFALLTTEKQIVYLALHLFHDNYRGYHKYLFLEKVINSKFNEQKVLELIKNYQLENFLYPTFVLLKKYYQPQLSKNFLKQITPQHSKLKYIKQLIKSTNIFEDERHTLAGIRRFKNIYFLSNTLPLIKPLVFAKPSVLALISFTLFKRIRLLYRVAIFNFHYYRKNRSAPTISKIIPQRPATANQNPSSH